MDVFIDKTESEIWQGNSLPEDNMQLIIAECLKATRTNAKSVFLNVNFIDTEEMIELNTKHRGKSSDTNVLSFSNCDKDNVFFGKTHDVLMLGDLMFSFEKIKQEAREFNKSFQERLTHLFVHGILHLLGYDHIEDEERKIMEALECDILENFGITNIYDILEG